MACVKNGPCLFVSNLDLCCLSPSGTLPDPCLTDGAAVSQAVVDSAILAASELLWAATGRQFGQCSAVIRPCTGNEAPCFPDFTFRGFRWDYPWIPARTSDGGWTNVSCISQCCEVCEIVLPSPVCSVDQVKINGQVIGASQYRVDDFRTLVRLPGSTVVQEAASMTEVGPGNFQTNGLQITGGAAASTGPDQFGLSGITDGGGGFGASALTAPVSDLDLSFDIKTDSGGALLDFFIGVGGNPTVEVVQGGMSLLVAGTTVAVGPWATGQIPGIIRVSNLNLPNQTLQPYLMAFITNNGPAVTVLSTSWTDPTVAGVCWPKCQSLELADTEDDTFSVTVTYGRPVPELVRLATAKLACDLILDCVGKPCDLPKRVTSITRQGVTMALLDPQDFLDQGRTGIWIVDQAIKTYNPNKLARGAGVYSVDAKPRWRRAGT